MLSPDYSLQVYSLLSFVLFSLCFRVECILLLKELIFISSLQRRDYTHHLPDWIPPRNPMFSQ